MEIERVILDLKAVDTATAFHKAKDVAAFANHLGGTIIIGATERDGHLDQYRGVSRTDAARIRRQFEEAVNGRCSPLPIFDCEEYPDPNDATLVIVVVNVEPSISLVAVRIEAHNNAQAYRGDAWVYPIRTGTQTDYLEQSQTPMFMTPEARRAAVMLSRIDRLTTVNVIEPLRPGGQHMHSVRMDAVYELENLVTFCPTDAEVVAYVYPLDCVVSVYQACEPNTRRRTWTMIVQFSR